MLSFLPIREGVSNYTADLKKIFPFPPYTGGCIGNVYLGEHMVLVSSLYGRVYRNRLPKKCITKGFLPIREGVSYDGACAGGCVWFPPYTGGCIVSEG